MWYLLSTCWYLQFFLSRINIKMHPLLRLSPSLSKFKMQFAWWQHPNLHLHLWSSCWSPDSPTSNFWQLHWNVTSNITVPNRPWNVSFSSVQLSVCYITVNSIILHSVVQAKKFRYQLWSIFPLHPAHQVYQPYFKITPDNKQFCLHCYQQHLQSFPKPPLWFLIPLVPPIDILYTAKVIFQSTHQIVSHPC